MQRKSTLAYGSTGTAMRTSPPTSRRRRLESQPPAAPPRSAPPSEPPAGLRLVHPRAVPRPAMSSIPPEPTSIRALTRVALPKPARLPTIEDDAEALDDADLTFVEDVAAPMPPVPWTAESTPIPANQAAESVAPGPVQPAAAAPSGAPAEAPARSPIVEPAIATTAREPAAEPRWIAPTPSPASVADLDLDLTPPPSPLATARARLLEAWSAASPRTRAVITFAAGFVAGGIAVAGL